MDRPQYKEVSDSSLATTAFAVGRHTNQQSSAGREKGGLIRGAAGCCSLGLIFPFVAALFDFFPFKGKPRLLPAQKPGGAV